MDFNDKNSFSEKQVIIEEYYAKSGDKKYRKYEKGKFLGKGGFAKCYEIILQESKKTFAAKVIPKSTLNQSRARQKLMSEIKIHKSLKHENIVRFEHFFEDSENVYILLELCSNQTMNELLRRRKRLTELEVQCYLVQLLNAIKFMKESQIIHRDLKLGNIFLASNMEVKVGDFGLATKLLHDGERKKTVCGTPNYIAPEVLSSKIGHSYEVDIWSLGVILYTLLIGKPPFETSDVKKTYDKIKNNDYCFPENIVISNSAKNLIKRILENEPSKRITLEEIEHHEFLNQGNIIPKVLPTATLACPPTISYLRKIMPEREINVEEEEKNKKLYETSSPIVYLNERKTFNNEIAAAPVLNQRRVSECNNADIKFMKHFYDGANVNNKNISLDKCKVKQLPKSNLLEKDSDNLESTRSSSRGCINSIFVNTYVDYTSKYGMGYILNDGSIGVCFNDSTKIFTKKEFKILHYLEKKRENNLTKEKITSFQISDYPSEFEKKVTLLKHFKEYLEKENLKQIDFKYCSQTNTEKDETQPIFVKKWRRAKHAIIFKLSNKSLQIIFNDKTHIILTPEIRTGIFLNAQKEKKIFPLSSAFENGDPEIEKRLKYANVILKKIGDQKENE